MGKRSNKEDAYRILKGNAVILFLYILLQPDYAYNIAKNFDKMGPNPKGKKKYPWTLARVSNVQSILKKLAEAGLLNKEEIKAKETPWKKRVYYDVNMAIFDFGKFDLNPVVYEELGGYPIDYDVVSMLMARYIRLMDGETKGALLKSILKLENPDYITVLLFYKQLILSLADNTTNSYIDKEVKAFSKGFEEVGKLWKTYPPEVKVTIKAMSIMTVCVRAIDDFILDWCSKEKGCPNFPYQVKLVDTGDNDKTKRAYGEYCEDLADKIKFLRRQRV